MDYVEILNLLKIPLGISVLAVSISVLSDHTKSIEVSTKKIAIMTSLLGVLSCLEIAIKTASLEAFDKSIVYLHLLTIAIIIAGYAISQFRKHETSES